MKSEIDYLNKIRYWYMLKLNKINFGFDKGIIDFKDSYYKNKEQWMKKNIEIK